MGYIYICIHCIVYIYGRAALARPALFRSSEKRHVFYLRKYV